MSQSEALETFKKEVRQNLMKTLDAFLHLYEKRNPVLVGMLAGLPPPKELVRAIIKTRIKINCTRSKKFKVVLTVVLEALLELADMFSKTPVFIENMMKGVATDESDIEVIRE